MSQTPISNVPPVAKTDPAASNTKAQQLPVPERARFELADARVRLIRKAAIPAQAGSAVNDERLEIQTARGVLRLPLTGTLEQVRSSLQAKADYRVESAQWKNGELLLQLRTVSSQTDAAVIATTRPVQGEQISGQQGVPAIKISAEQLERLLALLPAPRAANGKDLPASFWIARGPLPLQLSVQLTNSPTGAQLLLRVGQHGEPLAIKLTPDAAAILKQQIPTLKSEATVATQISLSQGKTSVALQLLPISSPGQNTHVPSQTPVAFSPLLQVALPTEQIAALSQLAKTGTLMFPANITPRGINWQGPLLPRELLSSEISPQPARLLLAISPGKQPAGASLLLQDGQSLPLKLEKPQQAMLDKLLTDWLSGGEKLLSTQNPASNPPARLPEIPQGIKEIFSAPASEIQGRWQQLFRAFAPSNRMQSVGGNQEQIPVQFEQAITELLLDAAKNRENAGVTNAGRTQHHSLQRALQGMPGGVNGGSQDPLQRPPSEPLLSLLNSSLKQVAEAIPRASELLQPEQIQNLIAHQAMPLSALLQQPPSAVTMDRLTQAISLLLGIRWQLQSAPDSATAEGDDSPETQALAQLLGQWSRNEKKQSRPALKRILERLRADPASSAQLTEVTKALGKLSGQQQAMQWQATEQRQISSQQPFAFPVVVEDQLHQVEGRIYREQASDQQVERQTSPVWRLQLRFDFPNTGPFLVNASLDRQAVDIELFAEQAGMREKAEDKLGLWRKRLEALGLQPRNLSCKQGKVPERLHQSVTQIIQTKA